MSLQAENQAIADRGRRALADAEGVLQRLDDADQHMVLDLVNDFLILFWNVYGESNLFRQVHPDPAVRSTAEGHLREALRLRNQMHHSPRDFELLESLEESQLEPLAWRAAALTRRDMRRFGVNLSAAERDHVRSLRDEFNGLPADYLATHTAGPDGQVRITTSYPDYYPFMNYARSEDARITLVHEFYNRAVPSNLQVLRRMLEIRHQVATLLGYTNWADYLTEDVMDARVVRPYLEYDSVKQAIRQSPHVVLVCNFPDPAQQSGPALLDHQEVVTFFHEFGHLVHALARGQIAWIRLADPERDFIEAPSQLLEEWIFDREVLRRFARHVDTGEPIPAQLVDALRAGRDFGRALYTQWLLFRAMVSLSLHDRNPADVDPAQLVFDLAE